MKSLLITTELFNIGGLETHVAGEVACLAEAGFRVHLVAGTNVSDKILPKEATSVTTGLAMGPTMTTAELIQTVESLRKIIREQDVECVHAHPFMSLVPSQIAAELEGIPFVVTLHGPASLSDCYGPLYDFLLASVILPKADMVIAVSQEVADLAAPYVDDARLCVLPNGVPVGIFDDDPVKDHGDGRWLLVSRLDAHKVVGIRDFIQKAAAAGLPGVLIVGDGDARGKLQSQLDSDGLSSYVEFFGATTDVPKLMQRAAGVAGMGRVVLEGLACCKPVVLVGYDGVKGVVTSDVFRVASATNFSGRRMPNIDATALLRQLSDVKLGAFGLTNRIKVEYGDKEIWQKFAQHIHGLKAHGRSLLSDAYIKFASETNASADAYLHSQVWFEHVGRLVHSLKHFNQSVAANFNYSKERYMGNKLVMQIASLNHAVAERDRQIANLNQAVAERDGQLHSAYLYNSRIDQKILRLLGHLNRLPYFVGRSIDIIKSRGFLGLKHAVASKIQSRAVGNRGSYLQPSVSHATTDLSPKRYAQPLLGDALVIITGVPFDDVGGGQRAAQLARCALKTGRMVVFLYVYKKFDFELNRHVESEVSLSGLIHKYIGAASPTEVLSLVSSNATLLIEFPHEVALPYLQLFKSRGIRTVFELIDDWESSLGGDWFNLKIYHQIVCQAQFVVGTAKVLVSKLHELGRSDAMYLPNAANEYIFDKYKKYERPSDLPGVGKRIALYFGSLYGDWFGWDYLKEAAEKNSDMEFVLIGDKPGAQVRPSLPSNVHFLGGKRIEELPAYLAHCDVGLLPFLPGKISDAVSPIKIFEYLFSGTPVVATKLPEIVDYPGISIANSPDEFSSLCRAVNFSDELKRENDRFIFENSWLSRLDNIVSFGEGVDFKGAASVIILIHNNKSIIGRCLESLLFHCAHYLKEVIVVDNASIDGGADFVEEKFPSVTVIKNPVNGCSSGRNLGVKVASGEFLAFFDSDQWFTSSSCFREALSILNRDANVGAIGWAGGWFEAGRDDLGGMITDYCPNRAMNDDAIRCGYRSDIGYLGTGGFFIPKSVFDATEGFDVAYDPTCFEDTDMSFQIKKLGFDVCYRDLTGIRHQPHQTTKASSGSDAYTKLFKRNSEYFKRKWAEFPQFYVDYVG